MEIGTIPAVLPLFDDLPIQVKLDNRFWHGSFNERESSLHQLSPYVGKLKSGMVRVLLKLYSKPKDIVLDPFCGSGVVPLESVLAGREAWANDLSDYAYTLTRAKLETPADQKVTMFKVEQLLSIVEKQAKDADVSHVPEWIQQFYHPRTLREIVVAFDELKKSNDYFITGCLLGIMHHVRPGFLSYPASHLVPYLRQAKFPADEFPHMYEYRDLRSRLVAKIERAYKRTHFSEFWDKRRYRLWQVNSMSLPIQDESVDAIISSPPYYGALDYARDNRLRLWFLGRKDWKELDNSLTANSRVYLAQMSVCLQEMHRVLKRGSYCVLVLGAVDRQGELKRTAEILANLAKKVTNNGFKIDSIYNDMIPDERRSRRRTTTTKFERILVMKRK
jgi:hypothetical protein